MNIKTVCALSLKKEKGCKSYTDYEIYPLASIFAHSDDDALTSYVNKMLAPHIKIQECYVMKTTLASGRSLSFYRLIEKTTDDHDIMRDYLVIDVPFIYN